MPRFQHTRGSTRLPDSAMLNIPSRLLAQATNDVQDLVNGDLFNDVTSFQEDCLVILRTRASPAPAFVRCLASNTPATGGREQANSSNLETTIASSHRTPDGQQGLARVYWVAGRREGARALEV